MFKTELDETKPFIPLSIAVLAVSDTRTLETDTAGALLKELMEADGHKCVERAVVRDDIQAIRATVMRWVDDPAIDAVITTGGTGFSGRDVTPEALEPLFEKHMDGFSAIFHRISYEKIGTSTIQSRCTAGVARGTYLFALPGSPSACRDGWEGILKTQLDYRYLPCNFVELFPRLREHERRKAS